MRRGDRRAFEPAVRPDEQPGTDPGACQSPTSGYRLAERPGRRRVGGRGRSCREHRARTHGRRPCAACSIPSGDGAGRASRRRTAAPCHAPDPERRRPMVLQRSHRADDRRRVRRVTLEMDWAVQPPARSPVTRSASCSRRARTSSRSRPSTSWTHPAWGSARLARPASDPANPALLFTFNSNVELGTAGASGDASFSLSVDRARLVFVDGEATSRSTEPSPSRRTRSSAPTPDRRPATGGQPGHRNRRDTDGSLIQPRPATWVRGVPAGRHRVLRRRLDHGVVHGAGAERVAAPTAPTSAPTSFNGFRVEVLQLRRRVRCADGGPATRASPSSPPSVSTQEVHPEAPRDPRRRPGATPPSTSAGLRS